MAHVWGLYEATTFRLIIKIEITRTIEQLNFTYLPTYPTYPYLNVLELIWQKSVRVLPTSAQLFLAEIFDSFFE